MPGLDALSAAFLELHRVIELMAIGVIPPFLTSVKTRELLAYSRYQGGNPPIAECGRVL